MAVKGKQGPPPPGTEKEGRSVITGLLLVVTGIVLYVYILYIMVSKMVYPASLSPFAQHPVSTDKKEYSIGFRHPLIWNGLLLVLFALQHSVMPLMACACDRLNGLLWGIDLYKSVYIICTCFTIYVINYMWIPYPSATLWHWNSSVFTTTCLITHILSWFSIACSIFTTDYLQLLGLKDIYYSFLGFNPPMTYKSKEQQQLLSHSRHPLFLAPILILWAVPVMTYDRLLVAVMLPLYLGLTSNVDNSDVAYVSEQFIVKKARLLEK